MRKKNQLQNESAPARNSERGLCVRWGRSITFPKISEPCLKYRNNETSHLSLRFTLRWPPMNLIIRRKFKGWLICITVSPIPSRCVDAHPVGPQPPFELSPAVIQKKEENFFFVQQNALLPDVMIFERKFFFPLTLWPPPPLGVLCWFSY